METRQLAYFLLACQQHNHSVAARELDIAPSTLSENLTALERELGLELFRLAPRGHYPTAEARALYQHIEHSLRALEGVSDLLRSERVDGFTVLRVGSPLRFALGRISKAASLAARAVRNDFPDVFFDIDFAMHDGASGRGTPVLVAVSKPPLDILIDYGDSGTDSILICQDPWVVVSNGPQRRRDATVVVEQLRRHGASVPDLPPLLIEAACRFCRGFGIPEPVQTNEDLGALPRISTMEERFHLLVPRSIFSLRLKHFRLSVDPLPADWASPLVARVFGDHAAASAFVESLRVFLARAERNNVYRPDVTLRQIRYYLTLHEHGNVTLAARRLGIAQPALSSQLRKLETTCRTCLFQRHRGGLTPTDRGDRLERVFSQVQERLGQAELAASQLAAGRRHRMTLGIVPPAERSGVLVRALTDALAQWRRRHFDVELRLHEAPTLTLHKSVLSGAVNIALVETIVPHSSRLDLQHRDPMGIVTSAGSQLLPPGDVRLADIADLPLLLPSRLFGIRQLVDEAAAKAEVRLEPSVEVNSLVMALALVADQAMATVMPMGTVQHSVATGELQFNRIVEPEIWRRLSIIYSAERSLTDVERAFIQGLREQLSAEL